MCPTAVVSEPDMLRVAHGSAGVKHGYHPLGVKSDVKSGVKPGVKSGVKSGVKPDPCPAGVESSDSHPINKCSPHAEYQRDGVQSHV